MIQLFTIYKGFLYTVHCSNIKKKYIKKYIIIFSKKVVDVDVKD